MTEKKNSDIVIKTEGLKKNFYLDSQTIEVLKGVDFTAFEGDCISIVGPSGVGKSTFMHIIGTLDRPTDGKVEICSKDISQLNDTELSRLRNSWIGFVFQHHHLFFEFSAVENVSIPLLISGMARKEAMDKAADTLNMLGLGNRLHHRPSELSGGEQQRVAIARAVVNNPRILLADEPTGNLDSQNRDKVKELLLSLNQKLGITLIITTHDLNLADSMEIKFEMKDGMIFKR